MAERAGRTIALVASGNGQLLLLDARVEPRAPHKLDSIMLHVAPDPDNIVIPDPKKDGAALLEAVRTELEARSQADEFSGIVLVAKGPRTIFHEAYGLADRARKVPNRKDTRFNLGSINKSFTQVAIHQLAKAGRLSLTDTIGKFLPDYPNKQAASEVTIQHLLNMTSGIGGFFAPRYQATPKEQIGGIKDYVPLFADQLYLGSEEAPAASDSGLRQLASGRPAETPLTLPIGRPFTSDGSRYANVEDGWTGIAFIETCVKSSRKKGAWTAMPRPL